MTTEGNGKPISYQVIVSEQTRNLIKSLHTQESDSGKGAEFVVALRQIYGRLRRDPLAFGEMLFRLMKLRLKVRQAAIMPVKVIYGVHEVHPLVFVRVVLLLPKK